MRFDPARFQALREARGVGLGHPASIVAVTGSTSDDALAAARGGAPHGALWLAEEQTRGRGRRGNTWRSRPGDDLTFSVLLRPELPLERLGTLTLALGLALHDACTPWLGGRRCQVKWPNDLLLDGRKLAGILAESVLLDPAAPVVVAGIGLNVRARALDPEVAARATTLEREGGPAVEREALLVEVLDALERRLGQHRRGGLPALLPELERHDALRDRPLRVDGVEGVGAGLDPGGALRVRTADGALVLVRAGSVELPA